MADRAKNQVVILHGWSETSDSFAPLANFLEAHNFRVLDLFLADYLSMNDRQRMFELFYARSPAGQPNELRLKGYFRFTCHSEAEGRGICFLV